MASPTADRADARPESASSFAELLHDRVFAPFFFANSLSNTGNWFQNVAAGIVVYDLTGSNTAVGAVSIVQFMATMLLTPWMGGLTDRVNRRLMLLTGQAIACAGASALAVTVLVVGIDGLPGPWPIYAATAVIGLGAATILPSLQAVVPSLVERRDLDRAIALNSMTFNIARSIGPIAAGATVAALGAQWAFGINALTFVPLLIVLFVIRPRHEVEPDPDASTDVSDGVAWIRSRPDVLAVLFATLVVGWTSDPFSTLMPAMAETLGGGDATVGLLVGSFGLGAALTAPFFDRVVASIGRRRMVPTALAVVTVGLTILALAPVTAVALVGACLSGAGFLLGVTSTNSELQKAMPEHLRGRVMAWWSVAFLGCRPIAAVVDGAVADLTHVRVAIGVAAMIAVGAALVGLRRDLTTEGASSPQVTGT